MKDEVTRDVFLSYSSQIEILQGDSSEISLIVAKGVVG